MVSYMFGKAHFYYLSQGLLFYINPESDYCVDADQHTIHNTRSLFKISIIYYHIMLLMG